MPEKIPQIQWTVYSELPGQDGHPSPGYAGPVTGIYHHMLLTAGGANFPDAMPWEGGHKKYYDRAFMLPLDGPPDAFLQGRLPYPLAYAANCSLADGIVCAGGENESGPLDQVLLLRWQGDSLHGERLPALPLPLSNAAIAAIGRVLYLAGGQGPEGSTTLFLKLDLDQPTAGWQQLARLPRPVTHGLLIAAGDQLLLMGGRKSNPDGVSTLYQQVDAYSVSENRWTARSPLPYSLSAGTALRIDEDFIALFGGDRGETFHQTELLIRDIHNSSDSLQQQELLERKAALQASHPGFSRELLYYDIRRDHWIQGPDLPFTTAVTTTAVRTNQRMFISGGEIRAGVRTPRIMEGRILMPDETKEISPTQPITE
ncbi:hypothetical protein GCM10027051_34390 [Niabella terrae]